MKLKEEKIGHSLKNKIEQLRYKPLEEYLKNQEWKEADIETNRLMLQTVGREKNDYLRIEEIEKFPCGDLRKIDQLWVKYSDGRFGFSVQKRIYQELGGTEKYDEKIWEAFGDRVGWRDEKGIWVGINYDQLQAPRGHLPVVIGRGSSGFFSSLAQRLVTCSIE